MKTVGRSLLDRETSNFANLAFLIADVIRFLPTGRLLVRSLCLAADATKLVVARDNAIDVIDRNKLAIR